MPRIAHYYQDCPICGRTLRIRVEYLGRNLACQSCRGHFVASEPSTPVPAHSVVPQSHLLDRANQLLDSMQSIAPQ